MEQRGFFITFEGSEGCGKSTQIQRLAMRLEKQTRPVVVTREPGGTPIGEEIKHLLQFSKTGRAMTPEAELLLFTASRAQLVRELVRPALRTGAIVIADRFLDSTTVYQGVARRIDPDAVKFINDFTVGDCQPDLTIILDLDVQVARERMLRRPRPVDAPGDRMEQQPVDFYEAVRAGYLNLARSAGERVRLIDGSQDVRDRTANLGRIERAAFAVMALTKEAAFDLLRRAHSQRRLAHAYLITGPSGSGKRALAEDLSALVTGASVPLRSPDVHVTEPESKSRRIVIEQMRNLERELQMRATGSGKKVGIVFDADRLQIQASNAFLKTLEEPPANSLILLTSDQPEALPETILSRCIAVPLSRTSHPALSSAQTELLEALREFFRGKSRDVAVAYLLVRKFTVLLQQEREQISGENAAELKKEESHYKQTTESDWLDDREDFYKALTESRYVQQRTALLETLLQWWADILRQQQNSALLDLPEFAGDTAAAAKQFTPAEALRRLAHLEELRDNLSRNVKEDLAIEVAFLNAFAAS